MASAPSGVVIELDLIHWASIQREVSRFFGFVRVKGRSVFFFLFFEDF